MKFRSCWLIFTFVGLSLTSCGQPNPSEIAETVKKSIVLISYQNEGGHGTGFIVPGPTGVCTVLTARHVVEGHSLNLQTNDQKLHKTNSIQANPNLDLAVVTFPSADKNCPYPSLELGDSDSVKVGDKIYISGFPDSTDSEKLEPEFLEGIVSRLVVLANGYGINYIASVTVGISGAPVLDISGKVVAVHGLMKNYIPRGIPIKTYTNSLGQNQSSDQPQKAFQENVVWLDFIVRIFVILVVMLIFVRINSKLKILVKLVYLVVYLEESWKTESHRKKLKKKLQKTENLYREASETLQWMEKLGASEIEKKKILEDLEKNLGKIL
ncbi:hypothetical protein BCD67_25120 [Oscillatoriales cyanobacterium USR001]|nr:hypothetical protein BCD67_25120 [Oscillatoriales cyanobacterium USR001]